MGVPRRQQRSVSPFERSRPGRAGCRRAACRRARRHLPRLPLRSREVVRWLAEHLECAAMVVYEQVGGLLPSAEAGLRAAALRLERRCWLGGGAASLHGNWKCAALSEPLRSVCASPTSLASLCFPLAPDPAPRCVRAADADQSGEQGVRAAGHRRCAGGVGVAGVGLGTGVVGCCGGRRQWWARLLLAAWCPDAAARSRLLLLPRR